MNMLCTTFKRSGIISSVITIVECPMTIEGSASDREEDTMQLHNRKRDTKKTNEKLPIHNQNNPIETQDRTHPNSTSKIKNSSLFQTISRKGRYFITIFQSRNPRIKYGVFVVLVLLLWILKTILFGLHSIRGGFLGPFLDARGKFYLYHQSQSLLQASPVLSHHSNYALLQKWETESNDILTMTDKNACPKAAAAHLKIPIPRFVVQAKQDLYSNGLWDRSYDRIVYSDYNIRLQLRYSIFPEKQLHLIYANLPTWENKVSFWTLCALYWYGGYFLEEKTTSLEQERGIHLPCHSTMLVMVQKSNEELTMEFLAASPKHPQLLQILEHVLQTSPSDMTHEIQQQLSSFAKETSSVTILTKQCDICNSFSDQSCCRYTLEDTPIYTLQQSSKDATTSLHYNKELDIPLKMIPKVSLQKKLISSGCEPSFLCNRCLRYANMGTYPKCSFVCSKCFMETICTPRSSPIITIPIPPSSSSKQQNDNPNLPSQRIPRIIHQTWFEEITPERYPELIRFQNSWKALGWDYRFYTDKDAREWIQQYFPSRFVLAYDALIAGAYKADFFRYLVLLLEGGVYVDIDVMLDFSLEQFITPNLSFFAPRDTPGEWAEEEFCLWNGFVGASPNHPIMIKAVERSFNYISNRADVFDMEREMCIAAGSDMDWWKIRAEPGLFLTGPCALGVAMNEALGRNPLKKIDLGWMRSDPQEHGEDHGDTVILSVRFFSSYIIYCTLLE